MAITYKKALKPNKEPDGAIRVGSVRTFMDAIERLGSQRDSFLFFRGHSNFSYELLPTIYRNEGWIKNEDVLHKELILRCPSDFDQHASTFQTLVKMQHYSLPTRLLDLTMNPLAALYFACSKGKIRNEAGEVVVFEVPKREVKYYDSDTVSVIANISRRPAAFEVPDKGLSKRKFNEQLEIGYLLHEIKKEKPYFQPVIVPEHLESTVCVKPMMDNSRIIKQDGAFFLFGVNSSKLNPSTISSRYIVTTESLRILVKHDEKVRILEQLASLGITEASLFPEIDSVAKHLRDQYEVPEEI
jgi:hypothetical protein